MEERMKSFLKVFRVHFRRKLDCGWFADEGTFLCPLFFILIRDTLLFYVHSFSLAFFAAFSSPFNENFSSFFFYEQKSFSFFFINYLITKTLVINLLASQRKKRNIKLRLGKFTYDTIEIHLRLFRNLFENYTPIIAVYIFLLDI